MNGLEYKVLEAKNLENFRKEVSEEAAQGWRVISMAVGPHEYFMRSWKRRPALRDPLWSADRAQRLRMSR